MTNKLSISFWALVTGSLLWLGLIVLAPWCASRGEWWAGPLYFFFRPLCHQLPERSFFWLGHPFAVCQRCTGLYFGFLLGLFFAAWSGRFRNLLLKKPRVVAAFALPLLVDVFLPNTWLTRFTTGVLAASPIAFLVWLALDELSARLRGQDPLLTRVRREERNESQ